MKLSEHFDLSEFTRSATADRLHIDNSLNPSDPTGQSIINNLKNLFQQVLEPLREHFGIPIVVSSGYRCPALNQAIGGVSNSQHLTGEATDIILPPLPTSMTNSQCQSNSARLIRKTTRPFSLRYSDFSERRNNGYQ